MASLKRVADQILLDCLRIRNKEHILIIVDKNHLNIGNFLLKEATKYTEYVSEMIIPIGKEHGQEPFLNTEKAMLESDVIIIATTKSLSHTDARRKASKKGARIITMPSITEEMMRRCIVVDYKKMEKLGSKISLILDKGTRVEVTTKLGTDIIMDIKERISVYSFGRNYMKGDFSNLPSGEVYIAPVEESVNGIFVVDASIGSIVKKPIKITVRNGYAIKFEGGKQAEELHKRLKKLKSKAAFHIGELGIGTNDKAKICGNTLEDEKVLGTAHIALGDNTSFPGGIMSAPCHIDGVFTKPTIKVDGKEIMKNGKFLI